MFGSLSRDASLLRAVFMDGGMVTFSSDPARDGVLERPDRECANTARGFRNHSSVHRRYRRLAHALLLAPARPQAPDHLTTLKTRALVKIFHICLRAFAADDCDARSDYAKQRYKCLRGLRRDRSRGRG
jgi:hypothetical protein